MTLPSSNPDAAERFKWRYERSCADFIAGGSEAVFRASLFALGYRGARLEDEVQYQICCLQGSVGKVEQGFVSGLPARSW